MNPTDSGIVIAGQAGQGVQFCSRLLARVLVRSGYHVLVTQDLMSRIRGGHNFARVRISDRPVAADSDSPLLAVLLDPTLLSQYIDSGATVLVEQGTGANILPIPMAALAVEAGKGALDTNIVALGALLALLGHPLEPLLEILKERLPAGTIDSDHACARAGYKYVQSHVGPVVSLPERSGTERLLVTGAQALALGALFGGARFFTNYPMAPASPIFEYVARHADVLNVICEQPEDEIAAVNLAIGASFAGAPAFTCTSASGFSLMVETLSLAGMTETPLVIGLGMRPGPATGMATRTAQADLLFALSAGHGEFPRIVFAPADAAQGFCAARDAVRLAEQYQTPVIVLFDQYMADASWTVEPDYLVPADTTIRLQLDSIPDKPYRRYEITDSGISPRLLPGTPGQVVYADSDEHTPEGHITESAAIRQQMVAKRNRKLADASFDPPEYIGPSEPEALVFCFGSTRGIVAEAMARLNQSGLSLAMLHLARVWPFPLETVRQSAAGAKRLCTVEGNYSAQLAQLLAQESRLRVTGSVRKYDGRQFSVAEVETGLRKLVESP